MLQSVEHKLKYKERDVGFVFMCYLIRTIYLNSHFKECIHRKTSGYVHPVS